MSSPKHRSGPPHNPGVRELVQNKRRYSSAQTREDGQKGFRGWHERGYLPHLDKPNLTQFVTFRLADSFPTELRGEWETMLQIEDDRERRTELEGYLDQGRGRCELKRVDVAAVVENALRFFHGKRYDLRAWSIMPNHVHVLFHVGKVPMSEILESWKSYTSKAANKLLGREGQFWAEDYWDTYIRDAEHERRTIRYTEENPPRAHLCPSAKDWPWSSARFRDEFGGLKLPA
jgi:REP element-mobilizing transposase RayT